MKKKILLFALLAFALVAVMGLAACQAGVNPYDGLNEDGATVSVRFDAGDGLIAGTINTSIVDAFNPDNYPNGIPLLTPDDARRGNNAREVSRPGHFLAGWYTTRTETEGGYIYEGRWDFETDRLTVDANADYDAEVNTLTLYAAWIPYCSYEFYDENGTLIETVSTMEITFPSWDEKTGKLKVEKNFPLVDGKTFSAAYLDEAHTEAVPAKLTVEYDLEHVSPASAKTVKIYTEWRDGTWFRIKTPEQLLDNARLDGCYEILADLDFTGKYWPAAFTTRDFTGTFEGNGHTVSNVTITQSDGKQMQGGLFGSLAATAVLRDLTLENITYILNAGSMTQGARFGLLAGMVSEDATLENVTLTGSLRIGKNCYPNDSYLIGLVTGLGTAALDFSGITCTPAEEGQESPAITVDEESGEVTLSFS